jgi:hypothetical protein
MDGRFVKYLAEGNTILSDLEEYFVQGIRRDNLADVSPKSGMSYYVLDRGASRVILISNHDPREAKEFTLRNTGPGSARESFWSYTEHKLLASPAVKITVGPLDVYVIIAGESKSIERVVSQLK